MAGDVVSCAVFCLTVLFSYCMVRGQDDIINKLPHCVENKDPG